MTSTWLSLLVASCVVAAATAGVVSNRGLTLTTSDRWLDSAAHDGACMQVSCVFSPQVGFSGKLAALSLKQYNPKSASYNIIVERLTLNDSTVKNPNNEYKSTGSIDEQSARIEANVFGQMVCQFAQYQCLLEIQPMDGADRAPAPLIVSSNDKLEFDDVKSNEDWLLTVTDFITAQVNSINSRFTKQLENLEKRLIAVNAAFDAHMDNLTNNLNTRVDAVDQEIEANSKAISQGIESLMQMTTTNVKAMSSSLLTALNGLRTTVDTKINTVEGNLYTQMVDSNSQISSKLVDLSSSSSARLTDFDNTATNLISGVQNNVAQVSNKLQANIATLQDGVSSSIDALGQDIADNSQNLLAANKNRTNNLQSVFTQALSAADNALDADIASVNEGVQETKSTVDTKLEEYQAARNNQTQNLENAVSKQVATLETEINTQVGGLVKGLDDHVQALSSQMIAENTNLTAGINTLEVSTLAGVNQLKSDISSGVSNLEQGVVANLKSTSSNIVSRVVQLDNAVVQITEDLRAQIQRVSKSTFGGLSSFQDNTSDKISQIEQDIKSQLAALQAGALRTVDQLSTEVTSTSETNSVALNTRLANLQSSIQNKIKKVSKLVSDLVSSVSSQQRSTITNLDSTFTTRLSNLGQVVQGLGQSMSSALSDSFTQVETDVKQVESTIVPVIGDVQSQTSSSLVDVQNQASTSITNARQGVQQRLGNTEKQTAAEISAVQQQVQTQSANVSVTNGQIAAELVNSENVTKETQRNNALLDQAFDATNTAYGQLEGRLSNVDTDFTTLGNSSAASFNDIAASVDGYTKQFSTEISTIDFDLDALEAGRIKGQNETDAQFAGIHTYLNDASQNLYISLMYNFRILDQLLSLSQTRLTDYLRPQRCVEGMGYTASASLEYIIIPKSADQPYEFLCDAHTDHGGWIVIQRRVSGDTDFFRNWEAYKNGFGGVTEDFWLGLERIHELTTQGEYELRVDMTYKGLHKFAQYGEFRIGSEQDNYRMFLGEYFGTAGNSMIDTNGMGFSTYDRDNDNNMWGICAVSNTGAWWYNDCQHANLNGMWGQDNNKGPRWEEFTGNHPVVTSEMKIRIKKPQDPIS